MVRYRDWSPKRQMSFWLIVVVNSGIIAWATVILGEHLEWKR